MSEEMFPIQIIYGAQCCIEADDNGLCPDDCPYIHNSINCEMLLKMDLLRLIQQMMPRVKALEAASATRLLTLEEAQEYQGLGFEEYWTDTEDEGVEPYCDLTPVACMQGHWISAGQSIGIAKPGRYNRMGHYRLWAGTVRPTWEQMVEAEWDE